MAAAKSAPVLLYVSLCDVGAEDVVTTGVVGDTAGDEAATAVGADVVAEIGAAAFGFVTPVALQPLRNTRVETMMRPHEIVRPTLTDRFTWTSFR
jgi:hypothetical protein